MLAPGPSLKSPPKAPARVAWVHQDVDWNGSGTPTDGGWPVTDLRSGELSLSPPRSWLEPIAPVGPLKGRGRWWSSSRRTRTAFNQTPRREPVNRQGRKNPRGGHEEGRGQGEEGKEPGGSSKRPEQRKASQGPTAHPVNTQRTQHLKRSRAHRSETNPRTVPNAPPELSEQRQQETRRRVRGGTRRGGLRGRRGGFGDRCRCCRGGCRGKDTRGSQGGGLRRWATRSSTVSTL